MDRNRLEAFSDGVLAIIITIMVLQLELPKGDTMKEFLKETPVFVAYAISYLFIAIYWVNHHLIFNIAEKINLKILWSNIIWMFVMSLIPFTTAWAGKYPTSRTPLAVYFAVLTLASIMFHILFYFILKENGQEFKFTPRSVVSLLTYAGAAFFGGKYPVITYIVVTLVSIWWIFPAKKRWKEMKQEKNKDE